MVPGLIPLLSGTGRANPGRTRSLPRKENQPQPLNRLRTFWIAVWGLLTFLSAGQAAAMDIYEPLDDNAYVVLRNGRAIILECSPPAGEATEAYLRGLLANPEAWKTYAHGGNVAIHFRSLNAEAQRAALLCVFKYDSVDDDGWRHVVRFGGPTVGQETLWTLCEWLTGSGLNYRRVLDVNHLNDDALEAGQRILFPKKLLRDIMKRPTPARPSQDEAAEPELADLDALAALLRYGSDPQGPYAEYALRQGEASIYTPVVVRFTDYRENEDILAACKVILARSGIEDPKKMERGQRIRIPLDMLSARFLPSDSEERQAYEATLLEAQRLRAEHVSTRDLAGVVVVLDPGHGGNDPGAEPSKNAKRNGHRLYEDEVVYDICCRIRSLLRDQTQAKVYMTVCDSSQGFTPLGIDRFNHDEDEEVLTTPRYPGLNPKHSVNLRAYLANDIFRKEVKSGVDERKVIFTSVHCDALFNEELRGAMIYIPGAQYRKDQETPASSAFYEKFAEANGHITFSSTKAERQRDEALSRNFAEILLEELGRKRVRRHKESDPIRNVIRRSRTVSFVPAVIRNGAIPTKVLLEVANMTNTTDCDRMADPEWRQLVAEAYVNALKRYYGS